MNLTFGDIVIVRDNLIGVVVKSWESGSHEVYVRDFNGIMEYPEGELRRYLVRHKELSDEEMNYQLNAEIAGSSDKDKPLSI